MTMDNYTTLQRNTLDGLSETAGILYLRLCDQYRDERKAFWEACRYDDSVGATFDYIVRNSPAHNLDESTITSLSRFMSERWRHNFMGKDAT